MVDRIEEAKRILAAASDDTEDDAIREQLNSARVGIDVVGEEPDDAVKGDRLEEVESKLVALGEEVEQESVLERLEAARDHIDAYRREKAQDWQ